MVNSLLMVKVAFDKYLRVVVQLWIIETFLISFVGSSLIVRVSNSRSSQSWSFFVPCIVYGGLT